MKQFKIMVIKLKNYLKKENKKYYEIQKRIDANKEDVFLSSYFVIMNKL
ncbi:MAG: hypothetical protein ACJAS4_003053 [Bacteriovoracaceae bacterium]|jgi:hypothetical protein